MNVFIFCSFEKNRRRPSSVTLMSPEIDGNTTGGSVEQGGFYMMKKDSQRRITLDKLLAQDQSKLCEMWLECIRTHDGEVMLEHEHLEVLIKSLRNYIMDQDRAIVKQTIYNLKKQLNFDSIAVRQLHSSLRWFQYSVRYIFVIPFM